MQTDAWRIKVEYKMYWKKGSPKEVYFTKLSQFVFRDVGNYIVSQI